MSEKRESSRIDALNLSYILMNEDETVLHQGMGRTLNLSEKGVFLETPFRIEPGHTVRLSIALEDELVEIKGRVAHHRELDEGRFGTGIDFYDMAVDVRQVLKKFIESQGDPSATTDPS